MPTSVLEFPFSTGLDEKTQKDLVDPRSVIAVSNYRELKNGALQKRPGFTVLSSSPVATKLLAPFRNETAIYDGRNVHTYSPTAAAYKQTLGLAPVAQLTRKAIAPVPAGALDSYDVVSVNGYIVTAYAVRSTLTIHAVVVDPTNGAVISTACVTQSVVSGRSLSLIGCGVYAFLVYNQSASANVWVSRLDLTSASSIATGWSTPSAVITNGAGSAFGETPFDVCSLSSTLFAIAYSNNSGAAASITVRTLNTASPPVVQTTVTVVGAGAALPRCVAIAGSVDEGVLWVGRPDNDTVSVVVKGLNPTTLANLVTEASVGSITGAVAPDRIGIVTTGSFAGIVVANLAKSTDTVAATTMMTVAFTRPVGTVVPTANQLNQYGVLLETRPFFIGTVVGGIPTSGRVYMNVRPCGVGQSSANTQQLLTVDVTQTLADRPNAGAGALSTSGWLRVVANPAPRLTSGPQAYIAGSGGPPNHGVLYSSTKAMFVSQVLTSSTSGVIELDTLDLAAPNTCQSATLGEACLMSGSAVSAYDGVRTSEAGFYTSPAVISATVAAAAGMDNGYYRYVGVWEQADASGQVHRSTPSDPILAASPGGSTNGAGNNTTLLTIHRSLPTQRTDLSSVTGATSSLPMQHVLYRTKNTGLPPYYRIAGSVQTCDPTAATFTYSDGLLDTALTGAPLYTQPSVPNTAQPNACPPGSTCLIRHQDRIFLVADDQRTVWFSKPQVYGEGIAFGDLFQFPVGGQAPVTALGSLDSSLVVFKRDEIYFVDGQGPADSGAGGDFSMPQALAADVGCIEPRSVILTPLGLMFQSLRGIELLTRGRQVAPFFGQFVETTLAAYPVIQSTILDEASGHVLFFCAASETGTGGICITYDLVHQKWKTETRSIGGSAVAVRSAQLIGTAATSAPTLTMVDSAGKVLQQSTTEFTDNTIYAGAGVTSPWIKLAGLQGYGRVRSVTILGKALTSCNLKVDIRVDYRNDTTPVQTRTFTATEMSALSPLQLYMTLKVQKCESIQVQITEQTPTGGASVGTGQGIALEGLRFEYEQKQGPNRGIASL